MDCEMVETEEGDAVGRASIVNYNGKIVYDKFVKPEKRIVDYRSSISGVTPERLKTAVTFAQCREEVTKIMAGKIIIGHSLKSDLKVLNYEHPKHLIRDVSKYKKYRDKSGNKIGLRVLTDTFLQKVIQEGAHDSIEDSRAGLALYREVEKDWENQIKQKKHFQKRSIGEMFGSFKPDASEEKKTEAGKEAKADGKAKVNTPVKMPVKTEGKKAEKKEEKKAEKKAEKYEKKSAKKEKTAESKSEKKTEK